MLPAIGAVLGRIGAAVGRAVGSASRAATISGAKKLLHGAARSIGTSLLGKRGFSKAQKRWRDASLLDRVWIAESALNMATAIKSKIDSNLPTFIHTISVAVKGGPEADLRRVWYLCLSAAFGRYRNRVLGVQQVEIEGTWDISGKACSVTIGYTNSGLVDQLAKEQTKLLAFPTMNSGLAFLQRGPDQVTVGGNWPGFMWTNEQVGGVATGVSSTSSMVGGLFQWGLAGPFIAAAQIARLINLQVGVDNINTDTTSGDWTLIVPSCGSRAPMPLQIFGASGGGRPDIFRELPRISGVTTYLPWRRVLPNGQNTFISFGSTQSPLGRIPVLPDDGRVITTGEKLDPRVQNPRPALDGATRTSPVMLVAQALQSPCFIVTPPPCPVVPAGSPGVRVYAAGTGDDTLGLNDGKIAQAIQPSTDSQSGFWANIGAIIGNLFRRNRDGYPVQPSNVPDLRE